MPILLATFFDFNADNVSSTLAYTKDLIGDFTPILIPIIAISLGLIVIWGIVSAIKK
jgi:hypothetical protein